MKEKELIGLAMLCGERFGYCNTKLLKRINQNLPDNLVTKAGGIKKL